MALVAKDGICGCLWGGDASCAFGYSFQSRHTYGNGIGSKYTINNANHSGHTWVNVNVPYPDNNRDERLDYSRHVSNRYTYTGREKNPVSGTMYYRYRTYSANLGQFGQRDPIGYFKEDTVKNDLIKRATSNYIQMQIEVKFPPEINTVVLYEYVKGNPVFYKDPMGKSCYLGEEVNAVAAVGPLDALTASDLATKASASAKSSGLPGLHNGPADAYRHCLWNCWMAQEIGSSQAKEVADIHEECNPNPAGEEAMDQFNNAVGRSLGSGSSTVDCKCACLAAVNSGALQTSVGGTPPAGTYSGY